MSPNETAKYIYPGVAVAYLGAFESTVLRYANFIKISYVIYGKGRDYGWPPVKLKPQQEKCQKKTKGGDLDHQIETLKEAFPCYKIFKDTWVLERAQGGSIKTVVGTKKYRFTCFAA